jgi:hypothetical protein
MPLNHWQEVDQLFNTKIVKSGSIEHANQQQHPTKPQKNPKSAQSNAKG